MDEPLTRDELEALVVNHLRRLPLDERRVLFRRLLHQPPMSLRAIADELKITERQARHLEARALRRLRDFRNRGVLFATEATEAAEELETPDDSGV